MALTDREETGAERTPSSAAHAPIARSRPTAVDERPLRILLPSYRSHPYTGGQGVYMRHISKALVDLGHHVDVISGPPYPDLDPRVGLIKLPSLDLFAVDRPLLGLPLGRWRSVTDWIEYLSHNSGGFPEPYTFGRRLFEYMRGRLGEYDVIHDNQTLCYGLVRLQRLGIPVAGTIHHPITKDRDLAIKAADKITLKALIWRWHLFLRMQIKVARELDPVIVVSESTKRDVVTEFGVDPARMRTVIHGIDADTFRPLPGVERKANRLMATASADVALKGLVYLIRAYAALLADHPDLELVVIGKAREGPTTRFMDQLGIRGRVRFVSGVSNEEINRLYAEATIAASPSLYEGFGFPAGEAMAAGVPVVATTGGALPEVVGDAGVLVPPGDPEALAAAIRDLLADPERRRTLGAKGRERVLQEFQWERTARDVEAVYREAIGKNADRQARAVAS